VRTWVRSCNYFNGLDHRVDYVNVEFTHRRSAAPRGVYSIPSLQAVESEWGMTTTALYPDGVVRIIQFGMPNVHHQLKLIDSDLESGWTGGRDSIQWRVPVDDEHTVSHGVTLMFLKGQEAEDYRARQASRNPIEANRRVNEVGQAILRGELRVDEVDDRSVLFNVQDYVSQVGLGEILDIENQHLGREDVPTIMLRRIFARELRALAEGRPLKQWTRPADPLYLES